MVIKKCSVIVVFGVFGVVVVVKNLQVFKISFWGEFLQYVMLGILCMVLILIMGGVIFVFSQLIVYSWFKIFVEIGIMDVFNSGKFFGFDFFLFKFVWLLQFFGGVLFGFVILMFVVFVVNFIGGKLVFLVGFIGGLMFIQLM